MQVREKHTINAPADKVWATFKSFDYVETTAAPAAEAALLPMP